MAVELEGLEFQIEAKSEEGTKGIDALTASLGKLKQATKGGLGLNSKVKELNKLNEALKGFHTDKLESLGKALASLNGLGKTQISSTIPKRLNEIAQSLHEIGLSDIERLEDLGKALRDLQEVGDVKIPKVTVPSAGVAPTMNGTTNAEAATSGVEQATSSVQETAHAVEQVTQKTGVLKSMLGKIGGAFSKGFSVGTGKLKELGSSMLQVGKSAMSSLNPINIFKKSAAGLAAKVKQTTSGLGKLFSSMKRIAMYRAIRFMFAQFTQAMKEGINNLYQYSNLMGGTFAQSMDRLATSGQYLKNSLGAMAAPIINALAPAIDFVIDKIVTLLNYINMLFARLSGASVFTAAKKNAVSYGDSLTKAGGSAAKAAKEIRDATTGIDELNIIMQKNDDGGGGGGGGADYGSMFEELPIDNSVSEFADKLKQAFDNADWKSLGTILGDKVNEIIDGIDWEGIGHKVGFGINGAIQTAYWFLDTVNFTNIGSRIAEFLNGALEEIDFSYIGRLLVKKVTIIWDLFIGFFTTLDWGFVAKSFSDGLKGMYDEVTKWLNSHDWSELGSTLWQKIKDFVSNIDWGGIATSIFTYLGTAIRSVAQFLGGFFGNIGADIKTWWDNEIAGEDWKQTGLNLLKFIGEGLADIGNWCMTNIIDPFCNALLGEEKWASIKQAGADMWAGFTKGLTEFFADPGGWIKTNIVDPFVQWFKDLFGIHSPSTVMEEIGVFIMEGLLGGILKPFKAIGTWIKTNILDPLMEAFEDVDLVEFAVGVKNTAAEWWSNVCTWWDNKVGAVQSFTTNVKNHATTWWNNTKTWWSGKVGKVKEFTTSVTNQAADWWSKVNTWWNGKVGAVKQFTTTVTNQASTWWSNVKTWWSGVVGNLTVGVAIKNEATTWWNNVKKWWNDTVGGLWTTLKIKIPSISVKWSTVTVFGKDYSYPSGFNLTWNAKGGILDGAQIFGMLGNSFLGGGEAGKEAVLPLETHTEWMDTLAEKVRSGLPDNDTGGMEYGEFKRALADFYTEYVQGTMSQMASDMNRQANKKEHTTVQVGNRVITDAVREQENANGYRFTTA